MKNLVNAIASCAIFLFASQTAYSQLDFVDATLVQPQDQLVAATTGDFDNNGLKDIAYYSDFKTFHVLYLQSDKTFVKKSFTGGNSAFSTMAIDAGDFNEDGKTDLVFFEYSLTDANQVVIFLSEGTTFTKKTFTTPGGVLSKDIEVVKFNNDNHLDIICVADSGPFLLYEGTGTGSFQMKTIPTTMPAHKVTTADVNNDGLRDFLTINYSSQVVVYKASAGGTFTETKYDLPAFGGNFVAADINNDQFPDIAVVHGSAPVTYLVNNGSGNFTATSLSSLPTMSYSIIAVDYDKDGLLDLIGGGTIFDQPVIIFKNAGSNTFTQVIPQSNAPINAYQIFGQDVDANGNIELVVVSITGRISISSYNQGFQDFAEIMTGYAPIEAEVADIDQDGFKDIVAVNFTRIISILYGDESNTYSRRKDFFFNKELQSLALGDFNSDQRLDIVYSTNYAPGREETAIILSNGSSFGNPVSIAAFSSYFLKVADINNDGKLDLVSSAYTHKGNGLGGFTSQLLNPPIGPLSSATGDLNGDDLADLIIANENSLRIAYNDGSGGFPTFLSVPATKAIESISIADVNGDDKNDIIISNSSQKSVTLQINQSAGTFEEKIISLTQSDYGQSIVADFNLDGKLDLVGTGLQSRTQVSSDYQDVDVYTQTADGNFVHGKTFNLPDYVSPSVLAVVDINLDNKSDIVFLASNRGPIGYALNDMVLEPSNEDPGFSATRTSTMASITLSSEKNRAIIIREANPVDVSPADGTFYNANLQMGSGAQIESGNFVVVRGNNKTFQLTNLKPNTTYHLSSFNYNVNSKNTIINYASTGTAFSFTTKNTQTINSQSDITYTDGGQNITVTSTSGLPVSLAKLSGNVTISGNAVTIVGPGPVKLTATQSGNDTYDVAPETTIEFCVNPTKPTIAIDIIDVPYEVTLTSSSTSHNQWFYNSQSVSGETNQTFKPKKNGIFSVEVNYDGCSNKSDNTDFLITGTELSQLSLIAAYPIPAKDKITVESPYPVNAITITDITGRQHSVSFEKSREGYLVNLQGTHAGLNILTLETEHGAFRKRIVIAAE